MKTFSSIRSFLSSFLGRLIVLGAISGSAVAQQAVPVFVTLARNTPQGSPPAAITMDAPGNGWPYSAAAPAAGTTWNRIYRATQPPSASGTYTADAPFVIDSMNNVQLYAADGSVSPVRLTAVLIGTHSRGEPGDLAAASAQNAKDLLNAAWRIYAADTAMEMRVTFSGLAPNTHYYAYFYSNTNAGGEGQGGRYILHPSNFPTHKTSSFIFPGLNAEETYPTSFVDLAGFTGTLGLFKQDSDGNNTIIPAARATTPSAARTDNTIWGALHAVSTADGKVTFRTASNAWGTRFYTGFQLIPYPAPTILEQPDAENVGVLDQITEFFAVAKDMPHLHDADQNPLTYQWQISTDNGTTWNDIPVVAPGTEGQRIFTSELRDPALPEDPEATPEPAKKITSVLAIHGTQKSDEGRYRLKVTNVAGGVAYTAASTLSVISQPAPFLITQQPQPGDVIVGDNVGISVAVSGTAPFAFTWQKSDTADFTTFTNVKVGERGPATSDTLAFPFVRRSDLGFYRAVITDVTRRNPIYSDVVYLYVEYAKPIITPPGRQTVAPGAGISLYGNAYSEIPVSSYQWEISRDNGATWTALTDGGAYSGATTETLHISAAAASEGGQYRLVATNALGTTTGGSIPLAVATPLVGHPVGVTVDDSGHLYVTDDTANTVYQFKIGGSDSAVLYAGQSGVAGSANGYHAQASFNAPTGIVAGAANAMFIADTFNATIRSLQANGLVGTVAGSTTVRDNVDGTGAAAAFNSPVGTALDAAGNIYVADNVAHTIRRITPRNFDVTTLAGSAGQPGFVNSTTTNSNYNDATRFNAPGAIAVSPVNISNLDVVTVEGPTTNATTLFVADTGNNVIRKVALSWYLDRDPLTNIQTRTRLSRIEVTTVAGLAGASGSTDGAGLDARFNAPAGIVVDDAGAVYVADTGNHTIRKIVFSAGTATVTTIGGLPGVAGYQDGPNASTSFFNQPRALAVDNARNVYVADTGNAAVRMIAPGGTVSTLVYNRATDPVPPTNPGGSESPAPDIPPAGSGDRGGDLGTGGGGAPSLWFFAATGLLALVRARKFFMKHVSLFVLALVAGATAFQPSARAADAPPAVFVNLATAQAASGAAPTSAATVTIAAPGSGWSFGAVAPYAGETWNNILAPHADDEIKPSVKGYVRYQIVPLNTANNITLVQPDGSASGVTFTAAAILDDANTASNTREVPRRVSPSNGTPGALLNSSWRIFEGGNLLGFTFSGLPADAHYLVYGYATTNEDNQGGRFTVVDTNAVGSKWFETRPVANTTPTLFATTAGSLAPTGQAPLEVLSNTAGDVNINTVWGVLHAKVDSAGKIEVRAARNANNSGYINGLQLIPYPKATITTQPSATASATLGDSVTLSVVAAGFNASDVITYQWRKNGVAIEAVANPSAITASLSLAGLQAADEGSYDVVVTNYGGDVTSSATTLTVTSGAVAPSISTQPAAQTALSGGSVSFSVSANGTSPLTYTWQKSTTSATDGFVDIADSNNATLALTNAASAQAGYYRVRVQNSVDTVTSDAVTLIVAPVITTPPAGGVVPVGSAASLTVVADTGPTSAPFAPTYEWKRNGVAVANGSGISGADTATLSFASFAAASSGNYTVTVTNAAGSASSAAVYLGTPSAMTATQWPANNASGINPDSPLKLTFSGGTPVRGSIGKILIHDAADDAVVESIDLATLETLDSGNRPGYITTPVQNTTISYQPVAIYGNEVQITRPGGLALQYGKTYYVTIEPGVLFDEAGATYPGIHDKTAWRFSTRATAPDVSSRTINVAANGSGDFTTLQAALNQIPQNNTDATPYTINLAPGVYRETLVLGQNRKFVTIKGTGTARTDTVISHGWANAINGAVSAVFILYTDDVRVQNLTIENTAGETAGQQRAVTMNNKRIVFDNVGLKGWQDTLAVWNNAIAYFRDCEIWGSVDFIYGGGTALFDHCDIVMIRASGGPVSAPSTNIANPYGLIFRDCRLIKGSTAAGHPQNVGVASSTLMRPWYQDGHTAFINTTLDDHISLKGWGEWDGRENTTRAREFGSKLADGTPVAVADRQTAGAYWVNTIDPDYTGSQTPGDAALAPPGGHLNRTPVTVNPDDYTIEAIFGNAYYSLGTWRPTVAPRIVRQPVSQVVAPGQPLTLSVDAFGLPAAMYQWYKNAAPIAGATASSYSVASASATDAGSYSVVITNDLGSASSALATVVVNEGGTPVAPTITAQPVSQIASAGGPVTLSVSALSGDSYQWFKNGAAIPGATGANHTIGTLQPADAGSYHVVVTNAQGSTTSTTVTLTVEGGAAKAAFVTLTRTAVPSSGDITPPVTDIPAPGNGWDFSAAAQYPGTKWNAAYVATGAVVADGNFTEAAPFRINSLNGVSLANPAGDPSGITLTGDLIVGSPRAGEPTNFNAANGLPAGLMDQVWRVNNGGNYLRFTFDGLPAGAHYLFYGYAANANANQGARYVLDPANSPTGAAETFIELTGRTVASTAPGLFTTGGSQATLIPGALLNTAGTTDANTQWGAMHAVATADGRVVVRTARGMGNHHYMNGFQLVPFPKATITTQPAASVSVVAGESVTLTVAATGFDSSDTLTYQWRKNGTPINTAANATANTATLHIASTSTADTGSYSVAITNLGGSVISDDSVVTVQSGAVAPVISTHPAATQTVMGGASVSFTVAATGAPAPTYQWYKDGTLIADATDATYTIASTQLADAGSYTAVATNSEGSATSNASVLTVKDPAGSAVVASGFAREVTGGAGGTTHFVTTAADLQARLQASGPAIITVSGTIDLRSLSGKRVDVKSNKTLQGADASATLIGTINIDGVQNVIVRGLNITNPGTTLENGTGPRYSDGGDGISIRNSNGVLVTHCTFFDCADGMCDLTYDVANATVSWNKFYYTSAQTSHRFTMILGNEATVVPITATLHHNWWAERADQRMPASSNARGHMFNNYFTPAGNSYASNARDNSQLFIEHHYYGTGVKDPVGKSTGTTALIRTIGNIYDGTSGQYDLGTDLVFTPPYSYELTPAAGVPALVSAHAGNTAGAFSITPEPSATITITGAPEKVYPGDTLTLAPSATGTSYQWRLNNMEIAGATSETLPLANIQASQIGTYTVVVGNASGNFTVSAPLVLEAGDAPMIVGESGGPATVVTGREISLRAVVTGDKLSFQWQRLVDGNWVNVTDGGGFSGATSDTLTVSNATNAQAGQYRFIATNPSGSTTSNAYILAVTASHFTNPTGLAVDSFGDLYVADSALNVVRKIGDDGVARLHAGLPNTAGAVDGALGKGTLNAPGNLSIDAFGNLYVADAGNATVRAISRDGTITTLAGDASQRGSRDAIGTAALFASPSGPSFDRTNGVTYVADTNNHTIRRLTPQGLQAGLFAGNVVATISGAAGVSGDTDVLAVTLPLPPGTIKPDVSPVRYNHPAAVTFAGTFLYVADTGNNTIRRISLASGDNQFTTLTLAGTPGVTGSDDGTGLEALFNKPQAIVADASGAVLYVADTGNNAIRRVTSAGVVTTLAGLPGIAGMADGVGENALFNRPTALALDVEGRTLYVADTGNAAIRKIALSGPTATVTTVGITATNDTVPPPSGGGEPPAPFVPSGESTGKGGGGAPSLWFFAAIGALALVRNLRQRRGTA